MLTKERGSATMELIWWSVAAAWLLHMMMIVVVKPLTASENVWIGRIWATHTIVDHAVCLEEVKHNPSDHTVFTVGNICRGF